MSKFNNMNANKELDVELQQQQQQQQLEDEDQHQNDFNFNLINNNDNKNFIKNNNTNKNLDYPPYSRLFVLYPKTANENELKLEFERYGPIEDLWIVKEKETGLAKGIFGCKNFF